MAKKVDPLKAKQARQKKIAIGGGVLLLAVAGIQVPRTMKMMSGGSSTSAPAPAATTTSAVPTAPSPTGTPVTPAATPPAANGLIDSDPRPSPAPGQLVSFDRFESKDPFVQQLSDAPPTGALPAAGAQPSAGGGTQPGVSLVPSTPQPSRPTPPSTASPSVTQPSQAPATPAAQPVPTSAVISVNGINERVETGAAFPALEPVFRLASVTRRAVKIGIAGGSYATGAQTVTLLRTKPLTLMNTADGTRYELRLVSVR